MKDQRKENWVTLTQWAADLIKHQTCHKRTNIHYSNSHTPPQLLYFSENGSPDKVPFKGIVNIIKTFLLRQEMCKTEKNN